MPEQRSIELTLDSIDELFTEPEIDPWNSNARFRSGIDEIMSKIRSIPIREPVTILLQLPASAITPDLASRTKEAIRRYCQAQNEITTDEINVIRKDGKKDFFISILVVLGLFAIIALIYYIFEPKEPLLTLLIAWTSIASWAILWNPVDTFVWGRVPLQRENRYRDKLMNSEITIRPRA